MAEPLPTYTRDEMDAILKRAIERQQAKAEEIPHEDLVAAAGEVGIPREDVEAAARDLAAEKARRTDANAPSLRSSPTAPSVSTRDAEAVPHQEWAGARVNRRAVGYFLTCMAFGLIGHELHATWVAWPILALTLSFFVHASYAFRGKDPRAGAAERAERRLSRSERRSQRRKEKLADFERKVQIGADAIARVIDEARKIRSRPFERDERSAEPARGPRVIVTPPPVRVEASTAGTEGEDDDRDEVRARRVGRRQ